MARKTQRKQCKAMQMELSPSTLLFCGGTSTRGYELERGRTVKKSSNCVAAGEGEGSVRSQARRVCTLTLPSPSPAATPLLDFLRVLDGLFGLQISCPVDRL